MSRLKKDEYENVESQVDKEKQIGTCSYFIFIARNGTMYGADNNHDK